MTPDDVARSLDSPLRLVLVAELLERSALSLRDAVLASGRPLDDVRACFDPLIAAGVVEQNGERLSLSRALAPAMRTALDAAVAVRRERLDRERFVRRHVLRALVGVDPRMQLVFEAIRQVCRLDVPVLVTGETGTGKELVARAIHELGPRRAGAFEPVNCATLPTALFESHMFGHARGAFTGAVNDHAGVFERSHGGTLFLDEIAELETANQAKLLRVLQERTFQRLGDATMRRSDFRLVAATHRDLLGMIGRGTFREDLYYRCNVFEIRLPSLRERLEDLPFIVDDLLRANAESLGLDAPPAVSEAALDVLRARRWPGNVRELQNVVVRAAIAANGGTIGPEHLEPGRAPIAAAPVAAAAAPETPRGRVKTLAELERDHIAHVLRVASGNVMAAAKMLGISRARLYRKMSQYGIERPSEAS